MALQRDENSRLEFPKLPTPSRRGRPKYRHLFLGGSGNAQCLENPIGPKFGGSPGMPSTCPAWARPWRTRRILRVPLPPFHTQETNTNQQSQNVNHKKL